ncbi:MAG: SDR family oxidoreductase [Burkholderiales bacterium]|jgi:NAD(P)-dependent dehydrogenase (short-subunit alcohol dehydrogenase family)|nr:SDR family oxidoreductase [Nitrosomonadaceae bacterium]
MSQAILITGVSGGFGRLTALTLLSQGHRVVGTLRDPRGRNAAHAQRLEAAGATIVEMDVADDQSVEIGVAKAREALGGRIDVAINNAGVGVHGIQECFSSQDWQRLFDINVFGVARVNRAVLPGMREQGSGLLIHVSSLLGRVVMPFYGPYNASKWALEAMAENYRVELAPLGIDSVVVEPGGYNTEFSSNLMHPSDAARASGYGEFAKQPDAALQGFISLVAATPAQDPQRVADAIAGLVATPAKQRPFRTAVDFLGMGAAITPYNQQLETIHRGLYANMGMASLLEGNINL